MLLYRELSVLLYREPHYWCFMGNLIPRFVASVIAAYPVSALPFGILRLTSEPSQLIHNPFEPFIGLIIQIAWFAFLTPISLGFPVADEGGINRVNMYPYIIPTALVLFFVFFKGWRWFK